MLIHIFSASSLLRSTDLPVTFLLYYFKLASYYSLYLLSLSMALRLPLRRSP